MRLEIDGVGHDPTLAQPATEGCVRRVRVLDVFQDGLRDNHVDRSRPDHGALVPRRQIGDLNRRASRWIPR